MYVIVSKGLSDDDVWVSRDTVSRRYDRELVSKPAVVEEKLGGLPQNDYGQRESV